jgi:hypothetical protein
MVRRIFAGIGRQWMGALALFLVLTGGTAWAVDEWTGANIQDGTLTSADYRNNDIRSVDVRDDSFLNGGLNGADIANGSLTGTDISDNTIGVNDIGSQQVASDEVLNDSLLQSDIRAGAVTGDEVLDNSLTGVDINESTLDLPSRARFVSVSGFDGRVAEATLPAGNYLVYLAANMRTEANDGTGKRVICELYSQPAGQTPGFIGDTRAIDWTTLANPLDPRTATFDSLSTMGGAAFGSGGGTVYAVCSKEGASRMFFTGAFWVIQIGGFF